MGKYGKLFRKLQREEWKDDYINYKLLKQKIKSIKGKIFFELDKIEINSSNLIPLIPDNDDEDQNLNALYKDKFGDYLKEFVDLLNKEFRKAYVFFINMEKDLFKKINTHLHAKKSYKDYSLNDIIVEIESIRQSAYLTKILNYFIHDNMIAIKKILKKFDKKFSIVYGIITTKFILSHLEVQNSDLEYFLQFKLIDEANVICENNAKILYKLYKQKIQLENLEINMENNNRSFLQKYNDILLFLKQIDDLTYFKLQYKEWFQYIKKGDKIMKNNLDILENDINNPLLSVGNQKDSIIQKFLSSRNASKDIKRKQMILSSNNKNNIILILIQEFFYMSLYSGSIIPIFLYLDEKLDVKYSGLFIAITPFVSILSLLICNNVSYLKSSMILSCILFFIGSICFILFDSKKFENSIPIFFIIASRILIGLGAPGRMGRKYIIIYVSKYYLAKISILFLIAKYLGFGFGPLLILISTYLSENSFSISNIDFQFNIKTFIGYFGALFSLILLIINCIFITQPDSKKFSMVKINKKKKKNIEDDLEHNISYSSNNIDKGTDNNVPLISDEEKKMINDLDNKLNEFNEKNKFADINLIPANLKEIINREINEFDYINKNLTIIFCLLFFSKFLYGNCLSFIPEYIGYQNRENTKMITFYLFILLLIESFANFFIIPFNNQNYLFRSLLIKFLLFSIFSFIIFIFDINMIFDLFAIAIIMLFIRFIEIICSLMLSNILPTFWTNCNIKTGKMPLIIITLGESLGNAFVTILNENIKYFFCYFNLGIYGIFLIILYFYKDFRIKAITRILRREELNKYGV